jgi:PAS domain S-box-containing protein
MLQFIRQNKNVIMVAIALFFVSMSVLILFLGEELNKHNDISANVVDSIGEGGTHGALPADELKENEIKFREIIDNQEDPLVVIGLDGMVDFASADFEVATGYEPVLMKDNLFYEFIDSADLAKFIAAIGKVIETGETIPMVGPYKFIDVYGEYNIHISTLHPYKVDDKLMGIIVVFRDITDEIKAANIKAEDYEAFVREYFGIEEEEEKPQVPVSYTSKVRSTYVPKPVSTPEPVAEEAPVEVVKKPALEKKDVRPRITRTVPDFD